MLVNLVEAYVIITVYHVMLFFSQDQFNSGVIIIVFIIYFYRYSVLVKDSLSISCSTFKHSMQRMYHAIDDTKVNLANL